MTVRAGEWDLDSEPDCPPGGSQTRTCAPHTQEFDIDKIIPHEEYSRSTLKNDIALIRLSRPIEQHGEKWLCPGYLSVAAVLQFTRDAILPGEASMYNPVDLGVNPPGGGKSNVLERLGRCVL